MIEAKVAVKNAVRFLQELYGDEAVQDIRLEEVELSEDGNVWHVTLSFSPTNGGSTSSDLAAALGVLTKREYKIVTVWSSTGEVRSMKIRTFP
jgi:uncharacterized OB-fold protein